MEKSRNRKEKGEKVEVLKTNKQLRGILGDKEAAANWETPPFTLKQVRDAIPKHCFERSIVTSLSYVAKDLTAICLLIFAASHIHLIPSLTGQIVAWTAYSVVQAWFGVGIWILAHECGHGGFSANTTLNHIIGWTLHSIVLIPFFSWKYSHAKHHKATGNYSKDTAFVPTSRKETEARFGAPETKAPSHRLEQGSEPLIECSPIESALFLMGILVFGFPLYLLRNLGGQSYPKGSGWATHYLPSSPIFDKNQASGVIMSTIGILLWIGIQVGLGFKFGWHIPVLYFVLPWIQVNAWLVLITYLQHTDPIVPHYSNEEWEFLKGALCTVDRDWGFLNILFHHITDTHVVHHIFSTLPFYHAQEATAAVQKVLGKHYLRDDSNPLLALWKNHQVCKFVDEQEDVMFYKY